MNKERRKRIDKVLQQLEDITAELEALEMEEQEAYDNLPESIQDSKRGELMSDILCHLDDAKNSADEVVTALEEARDA